MLDWWCRKKEAQTMTAENIRRIIKLKEESLVIEKGNAYGANASEESKHTISVINDLTYWWLIK